MPKSHLSLSKRARPFLYFDAITHHFSMYSYDAILPRVLARGLKQSQLEDCLTEYENLNVWVLMANRTKVRFIETNADE